MVAGVGQALDMSGRRQAVDLLRHGAGGDQERAKEIGRTLHVGRAAAPECEKHSHVTAADAVGVATHSIVRTIDQRPETHEVDGQEEVVELEFASLALPLKGDQLDQAAANATTATAGSASAVPGAPDRIERCV